MDQQRVLISGRKFAALRRARYLTQEEFAQQIGMSAANVRRLERTEEGGMQAKNFRRLADLLKLSPAELHQKIGRRGQRPRNGHGHGSASVDVLDAGPVGLPSAVAAESLRPVVDVERFHGVSAARPEDREGVRRGRTPVPAGSPRRFAVTVDGDCMEPRYRHGDVVIFSVDAAEAEGIVDGRNYFLQFDDGHNSFKRVFLDPGDPDVLVLRCWNEAYPQRTVNRNRVRLLARAIYRLVPDDAAD